jgi:hypothetical protein
LGFTGIAKPFLKKIAQALVFPLSVYSLLTIIGAIFERAAKSGRQPGNRYSG